MNEAPGSQHPDRLGSVSPLYVFSSGCYISPSACDLQAGVIHSIASAVADISVSLRNKDFDQEHAGSTNSFGDDQLQVLTAVLWPHRIICASLFIMRSPGALNDAHVRLEVKLVHSS